jgi:FSR family fosmidomycin resistance protein-like MFS transporter
MSGAAGRRPASRSTLLALSLGHGCADLCSGALFALLPFLVVERHYSYAAAGVFALTASVASALFQPLVGAQGDRGEARWLMPAGLILSGLGIGAVGLATSYSLTLLAVAVCSAGVAAYHPEGARWARHASSSRVTADMSVFSVGGGVGYALGPLVVAAALAPLGLHGTLVIAVVPFAAAAAVVVALRRFREKPVGTHELHREAQVRSSEWRPFACLVALFCVASAVTIGLITYVPLFLVQARATSPAASNVMTSVLLAAAAAGTLLGGFGAQRLGRRFVLLVPQLLLVPAIALLPSLSYDAMIPLMILIGIAMNANMSIALVLAQEYLPAHMGLATGLTIGLCSGAGGLIVAALGLLGDAAGPSSVLYAIAALPVAVAVLASRLPRPAAAPPETVWSLRVETER